MRVQMLEKTVGDRATNDFPIHVKDGLTTWTISFPEIKGPLTHVWVTPVSQIEHMAGRIGTLKADVSDPDAKTATLSVSLIGDGTRVLTVRIFGANGS